MKMMLVLLVGGWMVWGVVYSVGGILVFKGNQGEDRARAVRMVFAYLCSAGWQDPLHSMSTRWSRAVQCGACGVETAIARNRDQHEEEREDWESEGGSEQPCIYSAWPMLLTPSYLSLALPSIGHQQQHPTSGLLLYAAYQGAQSPSPS
ncbi:hypothetical protein EDD21DRAFT_93844 [Dissophora ornata]|nr:hypothetical protein EDD21DRAFT_93844 [Dissophora ornata]